MFPVVGFISPAIVDNMVVLPQPLGPTIDIKSPLSIEKLIFSKAFVSPDLLKYVEDILSNSSIFLLSPMNTYYIIFYISAFLFIRFIYNKKLIPQSGISAYCMAAIAFLAYVLSTTVVKGMVELSSPADCITSTNLL